MIKIVSFYTGDLLKEVDADSLIFANLRSANLSGANLGGANLRSANLISAKYAIFVILRCAWYTCTDILTLEMMRWDAISCGTAAMNEWVKTGKCPFMTSEREFYFQENKKLWRPGKPKMNHRQLFEALCKEKEIKL